MVLARLREVALETDGGYILSSLAVARKKNFGALELAVCFGP